MKPADKAPGGSGGEPRRNGDGRVCPLCGKPTEHAYRPFCSRRCADVDLGRWLRGVYVMPGDPADGDDDGEGGA